jgi:phosphate-selective porin OprO and OprP
MTHRLLLAVSIAIVAGGAARPASAQSAPKPQPTFRWDDHPSIRLGRGTHIDFRARFSADVRDSDAPLPDEDIAAFDIARRRIGIEGEIKNIFDFQVEHELIGSDGWRDVFLNYKQFDYAQVIVGKFKLPFSLDENTSSTNLDFAHRSLAASFLAPGRDKGAQVHGRVAKRMLRYELGVFEHDGRNARTNDESRVTGGQTVAGRVRVEPFRHAKSPARDFEVGVAFTASDVEEGFPALRGRTVLDSAFFKADYPVSGRRQRRGLEAQWRPGPFSVKSEWIRATDERLGLSVEDTDLSPITSTGWYVSGTWAITGEKKASGLDTPRRPLPGGGFGAVEVAARVERLAFASGPEGEPPSTSPRADAILGNADRALTFGANWYLNRWVKIQANFIRESLDNPALGPLPAQKTFWSRVLRFQLSI